MPLVSPTKEVGLWLKVCSEKSRRSKNSPCLPLAVFTCPRSHSPPHKQCDRVGTKNMRPTLLMIKAANADSTTVPPNIIVVALAS